MKEGNEDYLRPKINEDYLILEMDEEDLEDTEPDGVAIIEVLLGYHYYKQL